MKKTLILLTLCLSTVVCIAQDNTISARNYLQLYEQACKEQNIENIIYYGEKYIHSGGEEKVLDVVYVISMAYAIQYDTNRINYWYDYLKNYSEENDDLFEEELVRLQHDTEEMLKSKKWEKDIAGTWVCIDDDVEPEPYPFSPTILTIFDASKPDGAKLIDCNQGILSTKDDGKISFEYPQSLNPSQGIILDGKNEMLSLLFSSEEIKDNTWKTDIASIGFDFSQELRSTFDASIIASDMSTGQKIGAGFTTGLLIAGLDNIFRDMSYSYHSFELYKFLLTQSTENVIDIRVSHRYKYVDSYGQVRDGNNYDNKKKTFVRWRDDDSIIFVSNRNIISVNPIDKKDPVLNDYYSIKRKTSYWNPRYLIPRWIGYALGGYLIYYGIDASSYSEAYRATFILGGVLTALTSFTISLIRSDKKRLKSFREYNLSNIEKLRRKANSELSFSPCYNPNYDAVGASANLKF